MSRCPQCGTDELMEIENSGNAFCPECAEVVEPTLGDDGWNEDGWWVCWACDSQNHDDHSDGVCAECGMSRETSDTLDINGVSRHGDDTN